MTTVEVATTTQLRIACKIALNLFTVKLLQNAAFNNIT